MRRLFPQTPAARWLAVFLCLYVVFFFWLACRKLEFGTAESGDVAAVNHVFWSAWHGKFFWHFGIERSYFAMHQEWLLLLIWPLYGLWPAPQCLFLVQTVCLALSAVPMFLMARSVLRHELGAVAAAVALVMFPSVVSQNVNQLHTSQWVLPLLLSMLYFFQRENYRWYAVFCVLAAMGKENTPLTLLMFVPYAWAHGRSRRWWCLPLGVSVFFLVLNFKIVGPYFAQGWEYEALGYLSNLGQSWGEVLRAMLSPKLFEALFQPGNGSYLLALFQPVLWVLPLLAPEFMFVVPDLGTNLVAGNTGMKVVAWHYNVNTGAFLVVAAVFAIPRLERHLRRRWGTIRLVPVIPVLLAIIAVAHWPFWFVPTQYRPLPHYPSQREARVMIPADAPVLVGPQMLVGQFSSREKFMTNDRLNDDPSKMFEYDWAYFDTNLANVHPRLPRETVDAYVNNPAFEMIFAKDGVLVFRRRVQDQRR